VQFALLFEREYHHLHQQIEMLEFEVGPLKEADAATLQLETD